VSPKIDFEFRYNWFATVTLEACVGFRKIRGQDRTVETLVKSDGECKIDLEGDRDESAGPSEEGKKKINWLIENQQDIIDSALGALFKEYDSIRDEYGSFYREDTGSDLPDINSAEELKMLVGDIEISIHQRVVDDRPYIGILANCVWEREHGLGWLMLGKEVRIIDDAQMAMTKYVVEADAKKIK